MVNLTAYGRFFNMRFEHIYFTDSFDRDEYMCNIFTDCDVKVGFCKYYKNSCCDNVVYIEYIHIDEDQTRKGYATELVKELSKKYQLEWDFRFTEQGRLWYKALVKKNIIKYCV
jgi:hypothetical protein